MVLSQRSIGDFLIGFVLPLVEGDIMHVSEPIDVDERNRYRDELPHASVQITQIDEARHTLLSGLLTHPPAMVFDVDELNLAISLHNIFYLAHPDATQQGKARQKILKVIKQLIIETPSPTALLAAKRHGLLHGVLSVFRRDRRVSWWSGSARFQGQSPPERLSKWGSFRRVNVTEEQASLSDVVVDDDSRALLTLLMGKTPLTFFIEDAPSWMPFRWEHARAILGDKELSRTMLSALLNREQPKAIFLTLTSYAFSFERMLERAPSQSDVWTVASFLVYGLHMLCEDIVLEPPELMDTIKSEFCALIESKEHAGLSTLVVLPQLLSESFPDAQATLTSHHLEKLRPKRTAFIETLGQSVDEKFASEFRARLHRLVDVVESRAHIP